MKKYLMSGIAVIAFAAAFTSCSKSTDLYEGPKPEPKPEPTPVQETKNKSELYGEVFKQEFGKIDPKQNWGFTDQSAYTKPAGTRGHDVNRNQWGSNKESDGIHGKLAIPNNVSPTERQKVFDYFNVARVGAKNEININWTDFVVSQVWKGEDKYYDDNQYEWTEVSGQEPVKGGLKANAQKAGQPASDWMNQILVKFKDSDVAVGDNSAWEHVNDFNTGNHNSEWGDISGHTYMLNSGTLDFAYHNTQDSKYHNEYIIVPGETIDPTLAGYYYIGFDFLANGGYVDGNGIMQQKNMRYDRDWVFTDWIIRVSPGEFLGQQRIFVEDLITSDMNNIDPSDWDFNDAVFDAFMYGGDAIITLRAAGGTLNLTVGGKEVHQAFGVSQETMVNTGSGPDVAPVQFRIKVTSTNAEDIPVVVTTKGGEKITLTAKVGEATQKIAAPIENHVKWLKERTHIKNGYPTFMEYVGDASKIWYEPANNDFLYQKWY